MTFSDFNFEPSIIQGLDSMGYTKPTPIQIATIPLILEGKDLIACAQTGTGKTASYLLPVLNKIALKQERQLNTLILSPTRELAQQIDQQAEGLAYFAGIGSIAVYGGGDGMQYEQQRHAIIGGSDIMIATPGRLISFLLSGVIQLDALEHLILDEADRMLDMGFYDDLLRIIGFLPQGRQTLLFSATMPPKIRELAKKILKDPEEINLSLSQPAAGIRQLAYMVYEEQKQRLLESILAEGEHQSVLIFSSTKEKVRALHILLNKSGIHAEAFSSSLEQEERERILRAFKARQLPVIIGTDVLSRGIDVEGISLVVNYDVPPDPEDYIHRIGRTARAEREGTAITFVNEKDQQKFGAIEKLIEKQIIRVLIPAGLGTGPVYNPLKKPERPGKGSSVKVGQKKVTQNLKIVEKEKSTIELASTANVSEKTNKPKSGSRKSSARSRPPHKAGDPRPDEKPLEMTTNRSSTSDQIAAKSTESSEAVSSKNNAKKSVWDWLFFWKSKN